jgi:hypothetical protein
MMYQPAENTIYLKRTTWKQTGGISPGCISLC